MILDFERILSTKEEIESLDRTNPYMVCAAFVHTLCNYEPENTDKFYEMMNVLVGDFQPISNLMKQNIRDRMLQNNKYPYIGKTYFVGATPENDYNVSTYQIEVVENAYTDVEQGFKKLFLKSGGADSLRPITVRLAKNGNYYLWSDSFMGLLADVRAPESSNPWA